MKNEQKLSTESGASNNVDVAEEFLEGRVGNAVSIEERLSNIEIKLEVLAEQQITLVGSIYCALGVLREEKFAPLREKNREDWKRLEQTRRNLANRFKYILEHRLTPYAPCST